jgi:hypothetical protein
MKMYSGAQIHLLDDLEKKIQLNKSNNVVRTFIAECEDAMGKIIVFKDSH